MYKEETPLEVGGGGGGGGGGRFKGRLVGTVLLKPYDSSYPV